MCSIWKTEKIIWWKHHLYSRLLAIPFSLLADNSPEHPSVYPSRESFCINIFSHWFPYSRFCSFPCSFHTQTVSWKPLSCPFFFPPKILFIHLREGVITDLVEKHRKKKKQIITEQGAHPRARSQDPESLTWDTQVPLDIFLTQCFALNKYATSANTFRK